jgi:transposase
MSQVSKSSMNNLSASSLDSVGSNVPRSSTIAQSSEDRSPDPEVIEIATRRQFSASEKRMLLSEADRCKERGELGAFLRRKRIYSSMLLKLAQTARGGRQRRARTATSGTEAGRLGAADQTSEPR